MTTEHAGPEDGVMNARAARCGKISLRVASDAVEAGDGVKRSSASRNATKILVDSLLNR